MPVEVGGIKLHRVHKIVTLEQGVFVYHRIPGLEGNAVQDLGRDSVRLQIEGIFYGPEAQDGLEGLRDVYKAREPVDFLAEVIGQAYFGQVILERFEVSQLAEEPEQFSYSLVVTEYVKPPEPATAAAASVEQAIKRDADLFMEMATLPDMLALGEIPELTNPVVPLTGALDPIATAVEALKSATQALTGLFAQDGDGGTPPEIPPDWGTHPPTLLDWGPSPDGRGGQPPNILLGRDGKPILGLNGEPLGADGALRDRNGNPILGPHDELLGPHGQPVLGPNGALLGQDGQPLRGPNGELLGPQGERLGPDGQPVLGPNGELLDADGNPLLGPDGELLGPDGQALLDENGQPLGPDGQVIDIARLTVALRNEVSEPVQGAAYALTLGAEKIERGWLNMQGQVQVKGLKTETDYTLAFADFDGLAAVTVRTGRIAIVLTDEAGAPVAGTWYVLSLADGSTRAGTLDATGQAALTELEPGRTYRLSFPDYALTVWGLVEEMRPPTMRTGWVVIALTDEAGAPVAGAAYVLSLVDGSTRAGTLDATGRAVLTNLAPGLAYRLSFPAYALTAWSRVEELPRPVPRPGWVSITLVDEAGDPVPEVRYVLTLADGSTQEGWLDAAGQALLAGLAPGLVYRLSFPEVAPAAWRRDDEVEAPVVQPGWVTITVVDEADDPVPGARYVLSLADGSTHEGWLDAAGQALLTGLEPGGAYRFTLPDYDRPTWGSVEAIRTAAARPGWVRLAMVDEAGAPSAGAAYVLTRADGSTREGRLDEVGQAVLADLEPGVTYRLSFPEYDLTAWSRVEDTQAVVPPGWVALALRDDAGAPMAGAAYVLTLADGSTSEGTLGTDGQAVMAGLEPGAVYHLSFPAYDGTAWGHGEETQTVAPLGWAALALVNDAGIPMGGASYVLTLADGSTREGALDTAGQARLEDMEPGQVYRLSFPQVAATAWGRDDVQATETQPGWIAMTLVDEAGTPMAGAAYVLTLADGSTSEGWLDVDGQAVLVGLEPGQAYRLSFPEYDGADWEIAQG